MRYKFIYTPHVSGPAHSGVHFFLSKAPFLVLFPSSFSCSFSRPQCVHSAMHTGRKHYCKWPSAHVFISPKNRNAQWALHLSCQNIWLAEISKHWRRMSIRAVTQTVRWLHVAAGQQPTLRNWSSRDRTFPSFLFLSSTSNSCKTRQPYGANETFSSGCSTHSSYKLQTEHVHKLKANSVGRLDENIDHRLICWSRYFCLFLTFSEINSPPPQKFHSVIN